LILLLTEGHPLGDARIACRAAGSDYRGGATVLQALPGARALIADKGVEARLIPPSPVRTENLTMHSKTQEPQSPDPLRRQNLPAAQSGRAQVRKAQGLAQDRNPIWPMRPHVHERHLHRCNRHILVMSPEPSIGAAVIEMFNKAVIQAQHCKQRV
jgi:hypothetical protein